MSKRQPRTEAERIVRRFLDKAAAKLKDKELQKKAAEVERRAKHMPPGFMERKIEI